MKKILFLNLLLSTFVFSQETDLSQKPIAINSDNVLMLSRPPKLDDNISGTPYIKDNFVPAKINDYKKTHLVRFNAAQDEMEVKTNGEDISILSKVDKYHISLVDGTGIEYMNLNYNDKETTKNGYFIPVKTNATGVKLFRKQIVRFTVGKVAQTSLEQDVPSKFTPQNDRFFLQGNKTSTLTEIPFSKKLFIKEFNEKDVKSFLKKQKLDIKEEDDLIKVIEFYFN